MIEKSTIYYLFYLTQMIEYSTEKINVIHKVNSDQINVNNSYKTSSTQIILRMNAPPGIHGQFKEVHHMIYFTKFKCRVLALIRLLLG